MINPFEGLSSSQRAKLLYKLESHIYKYNKNEEILTTLKATNIVCILVEGHAQILNINYLYNMYLCHEDY